MTAKHIVSAAAGMAVATAIVAAGCGCGRSGDKADPDREMARLIKGGGWEKLDAKAKEPLTKALMISHLMPLSKISEEQRSGKSKMSEKEDAQHLARLNSLEHIEITSMQAKPMEQKDHYVARVKYTIDGKTAWDGKEERYYKLQKNQFGGWWQRGEVEY